MSKLYVAKMVILHPASCRLNGAIDEYKTEDIIIKRIPLGYKEVLTGRFFRQAQHLDRNTSYNSETCPYRILNSKVTLNLLSGHRQFVIDDYVNREYPLREATEQDVKDYVDRFDKSTLKTYYDEIARMQEAQRVEKANSKASKKKAKQIIRDCHKKRG